jgi:hypothetical protein
MCPKRGEDPLALIVDFRFTDVPYDMMLLRQHILLLQRQHVAIVEAEVAQLWKHVEEISDDDERQFAGSDAMHLEDRLRAGVTTRYLGLSAIVAIWANYEAGIKEAAAYVARKREIVLRMSDLRGSFLSQADRYFADVLKMNLYGESTDVGMIHEFSAIRNAVAHANGRLSELPDGRRRAIEQIAKRRSDVRIEESDWLVVSYEYVLETLNLAESLLTDLFERVKRAFPSRVNSREHN